MTTSIPTANVAFMFGREAATKLFIKGSTFSNLIEELKDGGQGFVFTTQGNPNFLSLEHTVNIGKSFELTLSLIDPTGEFEKRFLTTNVLEVMANSYPDDGSRFFAGSWKGNEAQKKLRPPSQNFEASLNIDIEYLKNTKRRNIYLAYGIGDQLSQWAGPFKVYIQSIDVKIEGPRILTIRFVATENHLDPKENYNAFGRPAYIDTKGINTTCEGRSKTIFLDDIINIYNPYNLPLNPSVDVHTLVVDTLRDYIRNATGHKNVMILLPNLNKVCRKATAFTKINSRIDKNTGGLGSLLGGNNAAVAATITPSYYAKGRIEKFLNDLCSELTLDLVYENKPDINKYSTPIPTATYYIWNSFDHRSDGLKDPKTRVNAASYLKDYYDNVSLYARLFNSTSTQSVPKHIELLNKLIGKLNEISGGEYSINYEIVSENNILILDLWKSDTELNCENYPLFAEVDIEPSEEFIIVGDVSLIRDYLYSGDPTNNLSTWLHPIDAQILRNPKYIEKIRSLTLFNTSETRFPFGDISFIPDEFAFIQDDTSTSGTESFGSLLGKDNIDLIKKLKAPVFRYNTNNPNVTELTIKESNQYWSALLSHFETVVHRKAAGILGGIIPSEYTTLKPKTITELLLYATEAGVFNEGISTTRKSEIMSEIRKIVYDSDSFSENKKYSTMFAVTLMLKYLSKESNIGLRRLFKQQYATDPSLILHNFINQVYNKAYQVNITTLPIFNISNIINLTRPCVLLMQNVNMPMIRQPDPSILSIVYSGMYSIMGFRHTIDFNGCHSEFFLQKLIVVKDTKTSEQNKEVDLPTTTSGTPTPFTPLIVKPSELTPLTINTRFRGNKEERRRASLRAQETAFHVYYIPKPTLPLKK